MRRHGQTWRRSSEARGVLVLALALLLLLDLVLLVVLGEKDRKEVGWRKTAFLYIHFTRSEACTDCCKQLIHFHMDIHSMGYIHRECSSCL